MLMSANIEDMKLDSTMRNHALTYRQDGRTILLARLLLLVRLLLVVLRRCIV